MLTLSKIAKWLGIKDVPHLPVSVCVQDSKQVVKGALFFALKGERSNGLDFLEEVALRGAFAAVVPKEYDGPDFSLTLFRVDDVLQTMHQLAKLAMQEYSCEVIGITGSLGKTTTRHFLTQLLSEKFKVAYPPKNYNSQRTLPLVVLNAKGDEDFLILEMAMDRPGQISKLVDIAAPRYVILSAISLAHYFGEGSPFKTMDEVAREKACIFCDETEYAVIHSDAASFDAVREACSCDHILYPYESDLSLPFVEEQFKECLMGAIKMAEYLGLSEEEIKRKLPSLTTFERRFETTQYRGITFINDSYNASPKSCIAAFRNLPKAKGRRIGVFGAVWELGEFTLAAHRSIAREALQYVDELLCIGKPCETMVDVFKGSGKKAELFDSREALEKAMRERAKEGDVVLVKGFSSHKLWEIVPKE